MNLPYVGFYRAMLCIVQTMPSKNVHPSHGGIVLKRINVHVYHQTFLHQSGSHTILAFPYQTFTGTSPNGDNRMS